MQTALKPRPEVYETYWRFAAERQAIFLQRHLGAPHPWTTDPILETYKFCNVFRASDRVSQYLIRDVAYSAAEGSAADRLFQIVAFRLFSKPTTWDYLKNVLGGPPRIDDLRSGRFELVLDAARRHVKPLYTSAFILCANDAFGRGLKHLNHVELLKAMFITEEVDKTLLDAKSLQHVYEILKAFPLLGPFMAYQIAVDLNYSEHVNFSENDFTVAGPGAIRGLRKVFTDLGNYKAEDAIQWMVQNQEKEFDRLGLTFPGLWGRPLHAIDCQGLFCEVDKYSRVAFPELASNRSRIKAKFTPSPDPMPLYFPPKWKLNPPAQRSRPIEQPELAMAL